MSDQNDKNKNRAIAFLFENSIFLIAGAIAALAWANVDNASYQHFISFDLAQVFTSEDHAATHVDDAGSAESSPQSDTVDEGPDTEHPDTEHENTEHESKEGESAESHEGHHGFTIHFLINDFLMALFFAIAGKEVWESLLPGGALSNPRKAATPLLATFGGIAGPALIYLGGAYMFGRTADLGRGWAIPCATDIAFSYLVARIIFGVGHPAIAFLLLLAIADDAAGLIILAVAYSSDVQPVWLLLTLGAVAIGIIFRKARLQSFWWYLLIPGLLSWISFYFAGIHPALGFVPIIPCLPHAHTDLGIYARQELQRHDTLNEFEHWWKNPVEIILGLFGLVNAGVVMSAVDTGTWLVLAGLLLGKPIGITGMTLIAEKIFGLEVPAGMGYRHIISLGMVAAIGFTVALFVSTAAFTVPGPIQDSVKMGALLSFLAAPLSIFLARLLRVRPGDPNASSEIAAET